MFPLFGLLLLLWSGWMHPDSRSSSLVRVEGSRIRLELRFQARSLSEALPLDRDGDQRIDAQELQAGSPQLAAYVLARYQFYPAADFGRGAELAAADALPGRQLEVALLADSESALGEPWIVARYEFQAARPLESVALRVRLFREQNPFHRDEARLEFQDDAPARHLFSGEQGEIWRYSPESERRPGVFADYWKEGLAHIAAGFDHLAFLLGLLLAARSWRSLLVVVTAFTLAHSITLGLAAFELVQVRSQLVEMAIALSIAYVGALNLLTQQPGSRWVEAFVFGLIHGLGFAGAIADALVFEPLRLSALAGFNLGVESGQVAIVLPLALLVSRLPGAREAGGVAQPSVAPRWLRIGGSTLVLLAGLYWFTERTGLLR